MKIRDIETIYLRVPKKGEPCEWGEDAFLVRVYTDAGITGLGESDTAPLVAAAAVNAPMSHGASIGLKEILIGENPLEIGRLWDKMYNASNYMGRRGAGIHAISAVDIALWDIASQYYGVPIHMLLGGKYREQIRAYGTFIPEDRPEDNTALARSLKEKGFTALKFGGGRFGEDPALDEAMVAAVRAGVGDDYELMVDVAGKWRTFGHARSMMQRLEPYHLNWIEEPVSSDDVKSYARLSGLAQTKISGGETLSTRYEFSDFIQYGRPDIVQPDITRCGGISEMRRINDLAVMNGTQMVPHGFSTGILLAATVQFLAGTQYGGLIEYSQSTSPLFTRLVKNMIPMADGCVTVPDCIGLGVQLDEEILARYRVD